MFKTVFFFIVFLFLHDASFAGVQGSDEGPFKSWVSLVGYLKSQGIDANRVNWVPIKKMCLGLKPQNESDVPYNKCLFEKARDSVTYAANQPQCLARARADYPDGLLQGRTDTLKETDKDGTVHTFERKTPPMTAQELEQRRKGEFIACMQNLGWINADDWGLGRQSCSTGSNQ